MTGPNYQERVVHRAISDPNPKTITAKPTKERHILSTRSYLARATPQRVLCPC
jgi:hypothetical protein